MTAPVSFDILHQLRTETRPYHEALEQNSFNQALLAGTLTSELTERFLAKMYGFLVPYEAHLGHYTWSPVWEIPRRYRAHLIPADLPAAVPAVAIPLCSAMPPLDSWAALLGAMYVLEGSTLGGQVIARQLAKSGLATPAYFTGYGPQTGPMWQSFCRLLREAAPTTNQDEIVLSAGRTFQHLATWLTHE